jgi:predicted DCC family thiol-disulfide oxidoreductase YuxK
VPKPILIFDGECTFCRRWISYWRSLTGAQVDYAPYQEVGSRYPSIPTAHFEQAVQLVEEDGRVRSGADAVLTTLSYEPRFKGLVWLYRYAPGFAPLSEAVYQWVSRHRVLLSRASTWLWGEEIRPARYDQTRWLYLRALGAVYLAAFSSFWVQAESLFGPSGIVPSGFSIAELNQIYAVGLAASLLLLFFPRGGRGLFALIATIAAWIAYGFAVRAGGEFFGFQWDALLLEMGFFSVFLSFGAREPLRPVIWVLRWLLFRVVFFSGYVKLASHDPTWRDLTALSYHFETQPLPTWIGWWFHQLPSPVLKALTIGMFGIELAMPFLYFLPRRPRFLAFFATILLQLVIDATGNYGFFGLQIFALSLLLLDDQALRATFPRVFARPSGVQRPASPFRLGVEWALLLPGALLAMQLGVTSSYGVFAVMTTERREIVFEGSLDGKTWLPYEFKWKPGDLARKPSFVEPHMPRLDWQLWFAALGAADQNPWVETIALRLLKNSDSTLNLFASRPFGHEAPRFVRASIYRYRFTDPAAHSQSGEWWIRERIGDYVRI